MAESKEIAVVHFKGTESTVITSPREGESVVAALKGSGSAAVEVRRDADGARVVIRAASVAYVLFHTPPSPTDLDPAAYATATATRRP